MRVACFLAREHGLAVLRSLLASVHKVVAVFTHRTRPKAEDPGRRERPEFPLFQELCARHNVPLHTVDSRRADDAVDEVLLQVQPDVIMACSWRRLVPGARLEATPLGGINLHRGELPAFAGAEPVRRALEAGRREVAVTAHRMSEVVDHGEVLAVRHHPVHRTHGLEADVERVKNELTPLFGPLALEALEGLARRLPMVVDSRSCLVLLSGSAIPVEKVEVRLQPWDERRAAKHEQLIAAEWHRRLSADPRIFNGAVCNLLSAEATPDGIRLHANRTDYRTYVGVISRPGYRLFQDGIAVMGSSCVLRTSDGTVIFARRGRALAGEGLWLTIPGGLFAVGRDGFDVKRHLLQEAKEELGIDEAEVGEIRFCGIGYDAAHAKGAEVLFSIETTLSAEAVVRRQARAADREEACEVRAVPVEAAGDFVLSRPRQLLRGASAAVAAWLHHSGRPTEARDVAVASVSPVVRAVVFDLDGVLIDSVPAHFEAWKELLGRFGHAYTWADFEADIGPSTLELMNRWIVRLGIPITAAEGVRLKEALFAKKMTGRALAFPGTFEALNGLPELLAVATSAGRAFATRVLERAGLNQRFRHVVTADDVRRAKPAPDVYRAAAGMLGVPARQCVAIEDSPGGIVAAQSAGMRVIAVTTSFNAASLAMADAVAASTAEACELIRSGSV